MSDQVRFGQPTRTKAALCPNCGHVLDGCTGISNDIRGDAAMAPSPGDPTLCVYCGSLLEFAADLTLTPLAARTREELRAQAPVLWKTLTSMRDQVLLRPFSNSEKSGRA